ncbi:Tryptophan synthase alpha chain [Labilithrix luteola]|uniref:Tryptophan synthase alpha chain n=2 Tax=Labilithrix luteola TaxID=1391654 RepID=A0A0K1PY78_9BACT|nr:Tryptophan synthase alpha chain [Labilithrix luteola]
MLAAGCSSSAGDGADGNDSGTTGTPGDNGSSGGPADGSTPNGDPCSNGKKDGSETDVDCGGSCSTKCPSLKGCSTTSDCAASLECIKQVCASPSASDGVKDGSETDTDCGGPTAPPCDPSKACKVADDCTSKVCTGNICQAPTKGDGVKNGTETDVDCGGGAPTNADRCETNKACLVKDDCISKVCTGNVCQAPTKNDHEKNGTETDIDCGGGAPTNADRCDTNKACVGKDDCISKVCTANVCQAPTKSDGVQNGSETDVDCGGGAPTNADRCETNKACLVKDDCISKVCTGNVCQAPTKSDGVKNGTETDVDCGGGAPTNADRCDTSKACIGGSDCLSKVCTANVCQAPTNNDNVQNGTETDVDCGGGAPTNAKRCATNQMCSVTADCDNVLCTGGKCAAISNSDGIKNGDETDIDCGGTSGKLCATSKVCKKDGDCASDGCGDNGVCADDRACTALHGGRSCGKDGNESCCTRLPIGNTGVQLDKYSITAGRMRAFVNRTSGNIRGWVQNHRPTSWTWPVTWDQYLPTGLTGANYDGVYTQLGAGEYGTTGPANEACWIGTGAWEIGARTYVLPKTANDATGSVQNYSVNDMDERALQCVTAYMVAALCLWEGARLPTRAQLDTAWGTKKYPWGDGPDPGGYYAEAREFTPQLGMTLLRSEHYQPPPAYPTCTYGPTCDPFHANFAYNYWGGLTLIGNDYSLYIAQPGRFPLGNGPYGHADLGGLVFNMTAIDPSGNSLWSKNGSFQGHDIPWGNTTVAATNKYWAAGGRCAVY